MHQLLNLRANTAVAKRDLHWVNTVRVHKSALDCNGIVESGAGPAKMSKLDSMVRLHSADVCLNKEQSIPDTSPMKWVVEMVLDPTVSAQ